jgi:hypothetical protein
MFETFAALSTISMVVIFVVLYQVDRKGRQEDAEKGVRTPDQRT